MVVLGDMERNGDGVHPKLHKAMKLTDQLHLGYTGSEATFVHIMDGAHNKGSRHYVGLAFDLRIWRIEKDELAAFVRDLKLLLGEHFDVVNETSHIHVEYDPKYPSIN